MDIAFKTFHPTESNPFSIVIDSYLSTQVYLDGVDYLVNGIEKDRLRLSSLLPICWIDERSVTHWRTFALDSENSEQRIYELKSYFYMNSIARMEDNFEAYLKATVDLVREKLSTPQKPKSLFEKFFSIFRKSRPKEIKEHNRDRLKFIKAFLGNGSPYANEIEYEEMYNLFLLVENIRHITIHEKMILKDSNRKINRNSPEFKRYFSITLIDGKNVVSVDYASATKVMKKVNELAYLIFRGASLKFLFPINEKPTYVPPQYVLDAAHAFMMEQKARRENPDCPD